MTTHLSIARLASLAVLCAAGLGLTACQDLLTENPRNILVADNLYTDLEGFEAGLAGVYALVREERNSMRNNTNDIMNMGMMIGVDNAFGNLESGSIRIYNVFKQHAIPPESDFLAIWNWLYRTVNAANTIIDRAENPAVRWTEADKHRVVAEARLLRAWAYRHLTYLWGDVPLSLNESSGEAIRTDWERTPRSEVRRQMEQDLLLAEQHLPETSLDPGKVVKAVAQHYLAELYLTMDRPADAESKAQAVINSGLYSLIAQRYGVRAGQPGVPFMDQFYDGNVNRNQGNTEVLWALQNQLDTPGGGRSIMRRYWTGFYQRLPGLQVTVEYGGRGIGRMAPTKWALQLYEPQDDRGSYHAIRWFYLYNFAQTLPPGASLGDTLWLIWDKEKKNDSWWPSVRKWEWADPQNVDSPLDFGDQPYLRLAETYLLRAEAQFKQGKLAEAAEAINAVRRRSNASEITLAQVTLDFILDERSRELLSEEHRRYTLLRTGKWLERTRAYNPIAGPNIAPRDTVLPIPQAVIDANLSRKMEQNPGY
jgi:starch-binding outer membrane protein, SusD/RagB family